MTRPDATQGILRDRQGRWRCCRHCQVSYAILLNMKTRLCVVRQGVVGTVARSLQSPGKDADGRCTSEGDGEKVCNP